MWGVDLYIENVELYMQIHQPQKSEKGVSDIYDDEELVDFVNDFKKSDLYVEAFEKTVTLAEKRNVPENKILRDKAEIDLYFLGGKNE